MNKPILVALGASAGGLEALSDFVKPLKPGVGACYVVVQHLSPDNSSLLTELISRQTKLPVSVAEGGVPLLADQIYITPPNHDIVYERGQLLLKEPSEKIGPKPSVNRMFHSLAAADDIFPVGLFYRARAQMVLVVWRLSNRPAVLPWRKNPVPRNTMVCP